MKDILENPDISKLIVAFLTTKESDILKTVSRVCSFSTDAIHSNYGKVQEKFSLYKPRPGGGKKPANYGIYYAGGENYKTCIVGRIENITKSDIGFLVSIPVPYFDSYSRGSDRDPITLIRKYIKAIYTIDSNQDTYKWEDALEFARYRIRIVIGLNIKDNHFDHAQSTAGNRQKVLQFSKDINAYLERYRWPAWVIPSVWSIDKDNGEELYFDSLKINWLNSQSDKLRGHLRQVEVPGNHVKMLFPFASMRSFLIEHEVCNTMLGEINAINKKVYFLIGDADLVSLKPIDKNISVFNSICDMITQSPDVCFMRLGGAYGFENADIAQHIRSNFETLSELSLTKSVLMTQLLRSLDIATRRIMAQIDNTLAYYSEAHTYIIMEFFDQTGKHFKRKGNSRSPNGTQNSPMTKMLRNSHLPEPDITAQVTKAIIQQKNWLSEHNNREQKFIAERSAQLLTSSRHDLVVIRPSDIALNRSGKGIQVIDEELLSIGVLKQMIQKQHNSQLTSKQLNSRFSEAGYGSNGFHNYVKLLPVKRLPFVVYFLTISNNENAKTIANGCGKTKITNANTFPEIYKNIIEASEKSEFFAGEIPKYESFMKKNDSDPTKRLNKNMQPILKSFFQLEYLLRWANAMMCEIKKLTKPYIIEVKDKTVSSKSLIEKLQGEYVGTGSATCTLDDKFSEVEKIENIIKKRHENAKNQHEYDKRFGLVLNNMNLLSIS